jgi:putative ABC transport system substrate-binding protein
MNNRRKLVIALGAGALGAPFDLYAQPQSKVWRVGFLSQGARPAALDSDVFGAFMRGMRDLGYVEAKNLAMEWRFADGKYERLPGLAAELARLKVDVIVTQGTPDTRAAQKSTTTIPIVMANVADPVGSRFIASLARPGGNITGLSNLLDGVVSKQLEMLLDMVPGLTRVAVLFNPGNPSNIESLTSIQGSAQKTSVKILPFEARTLNDIDTVVSRMAREKAGAVIIAGDGFLNQQQRRISELMEKHRLPAISVRKEYVEAGGLMSYGQNQTDSFRRAATFVDKIFKGAKPADLPVEQPTKFDMFINGKTAKLLGLKIPQSLLVMADKVIE